MTEAASSLGWLADAGLEPKVLEHLELLDAQLWSGEGVEAPLLELVRLRIAQLLDAPAELDRRTPAAVDAGLDETMVTELSMWPTSPRFDERQRAVLSWSEQWVIDPEQITDEDASRLTAALTEKECAALSTSLAVFESLTRTRVALGLA
jgi:alkylhydroperoxidase family enzyme